MFYSLSACLFSYCFCCRLMLLCLSCFFFWLNHKIADYRLHNTDLVLELVRSVCISCERDEIVVGFFHVLNFISQSLLTPLFDRLYNSTIVTGDKSLNLFNGCCSLLIIELRTENNASLILVHSLLPPFGLWPFLLEKQGIVIQLTMIAKFSTVCKH